MTQEKLLLEQGMVDAVREVQISLDSLLTLLGLRIDLADTSEGYYWDNCREIVVKIKSEVNRLPGWVRP